MEQVATSHLTEKTPEELRQLQLEDSPIGLLLQAVENGEKPTADEVRAQGPEAQRLWHLWNRLVVEEGVLKRRYDNTSGKSSWLQLVLPQLLREEVLQELHAGALEGHLGEEKLLGKVKERFYWPGMQQDARDWCRTCEFCATRKTAPKRNCAPLQTIKAGFPMQVVAADILGPLPESEAGNSYVLVASDYFTKWMEAYAIPNQEAITVARKLTDEMFCRFSPPDQLHSDQGKQFEAEVLQEICRILKIKKTRTTPYHPQSDGLVERLNRTLLSMLATTTRDHPFDWEDQIRKVCMAYNTSIHSSTGYTAFYLMFGRQARLPIDLVYGTGDHRESSPDNYAIQMKNGLKEAYSLVRKKLERTHELRKEKYDRKVHGEPYKEGDLVWMHSPVTAKGGSRKLHHAWTGPFKVIKKLSDCDYRIKGLRGRKQLHVVHFNRLKPCTPGMRFSNPEQIADQDDPTPLDHNMVPDSFGNDMELIEDESELPNTQVVERRYPQRTRHPPDRYEPVVVH